MSTFIKLNKQDAFITPYTAHKSYSYTNQADRISAGIRFRFGNETGEIYNPNDTVAGAAKLYHTSIKHLYYSNFTSSVNPSNAIESGSFENYNQSTLFFTRSLEGNVTTISIPRNIYGENIKPATFQFNSGSVFHIVDDGEGNLFASGAASYLAVTSSSFDFQTVNFAATASSGYESIPEPLILNLAESIIEYTGSLEKVEWRGSLASSPLYIDNGATQTLIVSGTSELSVLSFNSDTELVSSDSQRVLFQDNSGTDELSFYFTSSSIDSTETVTEIYPSASIADGEYIGNIFYSHGMAVITKSDIAERFANKVLSSGSLSWQGAHTIYEHTYQCKSNQSQLNYSLNPSSFNNTLESGSVNSNITGSYFQPYITTVGLYNDVHELIAIGKLAQPIPKSRYNDMTFVVKFDS